MVMTKKSLRIAMVISSLSSGGAERVLVLVALGCLAVDRVLPGLLPELP